MYSLCDSVHLSGSLCRCRVVWDSVLLLRCLGLSISFVLSGCLYSWVLSGLTLYGFTAVLCISHNIGWSLLFSEGLGNRPAAQAARADPSWWNSSNRQTPPTSAKSSLLLNQQCDWDVLLDLECPKPVGSSLFYDWKSNLKPFGRGGFLGRKRMNQLVNQSVTEVFVEQPLALPGSAKHLRH